MAGGNWKSKIKKNVLVVGFGESGLSACRWLVRQGSHVTVSEERKESDFDQGVVADLVQSGVTFEFGGHGAETFLDSDVIVVSPGISLDIKPLSLARDRGVPIIGEIELASGYLKTPCIAVTGTNGKTTVVRLIGEMLRQGGKRVFVGGNIGHPLTNCLYEEQEIDYAVVEVSSFQLDTIQAFSPLVSLILNISPDHLDRYADYSAYVRSKEMVFANQGAGQALIVNDDDPWLRKAKPKNGLTVYRYGLESTSGRNAVLHNGDIVVRLPKKKMITFHLDRFSLPGSHNRANLMAAILACVILKVSHAAIQEVVDHFKGLLHRIEYVDTVRGIDFYNDSKATNIDAAVKAIASFSKPIVLIAGGRHKGSDYHQLVEAASKRVKKAVFLGEASTILSEAFGNKIAWSMASSMIDAVSFAFDQAQKGDVVLLAPACSSFDMFKDFKQRGEVFKEAVRKLKNGCAKRDSES